MRTHKTTLLLAGTVVAGFSTSVASADVIGIDNRSGTTIVGAPQMGTGTGYEQLRAKLTALGHTIVPITNFDSGELDQLDALIYRQALVPSEALSTAEIGAIQAFAFAGGGLIAIADGGFLSDDTVANFNAVTQPFGIRASELTEGPTGLNVEQFVTHPATVGVDGFAMDFVRPLSLVVPPATALTLSGPTLLATRTGAGGSGNAVFLADSTLWADDDSGADATIGSAHNEQLLEGVVAFSLAQPTEITALCTERNGTGVNPSGFDCANTPKIGSTWLTTVEVGPTTLATVIAFSRGPATVGGPLFVGELLLPTSAPMFLDWSLGQHAIAVPADPGLIGLVGTAQAARLEPSPGAIETQLQNAQEVLLGDG